MKVTKRGLIFLIYFILFEFIALTHKFITYNLYSTDFRILCIFVWMILAFLTFFLNKIPLQIDRVGKFILFFSFLIVIEMIISKFRYGQSLQQSAKMGYFYLSFYSYFLFDWIIKKKRDFMILRKVFLGFTLFFSIFGLLVASYRFLFYEILISLPLFFENYFNKKRINDLCSLFIIITYLLITGDNLSKRLVFVVCLIMEILIHKVFKASSDGKASKHKITNIVLLLLFAALVLYKPISNIVQQLINKDYGMMARTEAYSYYFSQFLSHPLLGMGLIDPKSSAQNNLLVMGINSKGLSLFYLDDIGVVGFINQFGLAGICLLVYLIKTMIEFIQDNNNKLIIENLLLFIVYLVMNIALLPTNKTVLPMFVVMLVLMKKNKQFCVQEKENSYDT